MFEVKFLEVQYFKVQPNTNKRASKRELDECRVGVEKNNILDDKVKTKVHEGKTTYLSCLDYGPPLYVLLVLIYIVF